ncbi:unnamed protein product [Blepharisma stoltei]|uniref:Uncharacterized protein n=1 Tax=Blepharisma stoltei TaxID=1481888 RepID=A0AAU9K0G2_9CILI|nr:unnamed protein product [Blepharisma stoltei]
MSNPSSMPTVVKVNFSLKKFKRLVSRRVSENNESTIENDNKGIEALKQVYYSSPKKRPKSGHLISPYENRPKSFQLFPDTQRKRFFMRPASELKGDKAAESFQKELKLIKEDTVADQLKYNIKKAKSDKIELMRDIATYESNFSAKTALSSKFRTLAENCAMIKFLFEETKSSNNAKLLLKENIENALDMLHSPDNSMILLNKKEKINIIKSKSFKFVDRKVSHQIFAGIALVSLLSCIINIQLNKNSHDYLISMKIPSGQILSLYLNKNLLVSRKSNIAKDQIIPHLWIKIDSHQYSLVYDPECSITFLSFVLSLKGDASNLNTVLIRETLLILKIQIIGTLFSIDIDKSLITDKSSIFLEHPHKIARILRSKICFSRKNKSFIWIEDSSADHCFKFKELSSNFLDEKYLNQAFNDIKTGDFLMYKIRIKGKLYTLEYYSQKGEESLKILFSKNSILLTKWSKEYNYLMSLQFESQFSICTLSKSLELEYFLSNLNKSEIFIN